MPKTYTWTKYVGRCVRGCDQLFRVSQEILDEQRRDYDNVGTDAEVAESLDFCIECVSGVAVSGEKDIPPVDEIEMLARELVHAYDEEVIGFVHGKRIAELAEKIRLSSSEADVGAAQTIALDANHDARNCAECEKPLADHEKKFGTCDDCAEAENDKDFENLSSRVAALPQLGDWNITVHSSDKKTKSVSVDIQKTDDVIVSVFAPDGIVKHYRLSLDSADHDVWIKRISAVEAARER